MATPIQVRAIREAAEASAVAGSDNQIEQFAAMDARFHDAVSIAAHNVFLQASVVNVRKFAAQTDVLLFHGAAPGSLAEAGRQHVAIARSIADGDAEQASALMSAHVETTQRQFERRIRDRLFNLGGQG